MFAFFGRKLSDIWRIFERFRGSSEELLESIDAICTQAAIEVVALEVVPLVVVQ